MVPTCAENYCISLLSILHNSHHDRWSTPFILSTLFLFGGGGGSFGGLPRSKIRFSLEVFYFSQYGLAHNSDPNDRG